MFCIECITLRKCNCAILTGNTTNDPSSKVVDSQVIDLCYTKVTVYDLL